MGTTSTAERIKRWRDETQIVWTLSHGTQQQDRVAADMHEARFGNVRALGEQKIQWIPPRMAVAVIGVKR